MTSKSYRYFVLTGDPGVGKTTLVKKIVSLISGEGVKTSGFYTEEVRKNGVREGFDVVALDGKRGRLARDQTLISGPVKCRVGKYGVLVKEFETVALPCLVQPDATHTRSHIIVVDEIGKMELFSSQFKNSIKSIFSESVCNIILATIPVRINDLLVDNIRNNNKTKVWMVTKENRNSVHLEILNEIKVALKFD